MCAQNVSFRNRARGPPPPFSCSAFCDTQSASFGASLILSPTTCLAQVVAHLCCYHAYLSPVVNAPTLISCVLRSGCLDVRTKQIQTTGGITVGSSNKHDVLEVAAGTACPPAPAKVDQALQKQEKHKRTRFPWTPEQEESLAKQVRNFFEYQSKSRLSSAGTLFFGCYF